MRPGRENGFLLNPHGATVALNLGADYCAEHEWGIGSLHIAFGVTGEDYGLERRKIRKVPELLRVAEFQAEPPRDYTKRKKPGKVPAWGFWLPSHDTSMRMEEGSYGPRFYGGDTLWTGWSGEDLGAASIDPGEIKRLQEIYKSIQDLDCCIWLGGGGVFQNAGLVLGIVSRMDPDIFEKWDATDRENAEVKAAGKATGIEEFLKKAGKGWFFLGPKKMGDGSIKFWLNPWEQDKYNAGYYSVEELKQWAQEKGPVMKQSKRR